MVENKIYIEDYAGLSPRCTVFSATDDFNGNYLVGSMVDEKNIEILLVGQLLSRDYVQVGAGSIILRILHSKKESQLVLCP